MQAYWTLMRRELAAFFCSITGYVVIAGMTWLVGGDLWWLLKSQGTQPFTMPVTQLFFNNLLLWILIVLTAPIITMRLFAQEKAIGTFETLMTTPVGDVQVVAAKFTAAVVFFIVMWLPSLASLFVLQHFVNQPGAMDKGTLLSMYLGVFLAGCLLLSLGCFASAITRSQVLAAMVTLVAGLGLLILNGIVQSISPNSQWQTQLFSLFNLSQQMFDFTRGILDTRVIVYYLSVTFFFLFLTLRVIESRRWK